MGRADTTKDVAAFLSAYQANAERVTHDIVRINDISNFFGARSCAPSYGMMATEKPLSLMLVEIDSIYCDGTFSTINFVSTVNEKSSSHSVVQLTQLLSTIRDLQRCAHQTGHLPPMQRSRFTTSPTASFPIELRSKVSLIAVTQCGYLQPCNG